MTSETSVAEVKARPRRYGLTRQFALLAFVCIGSVSIASSVLLSRFLTRHLLERDAQILMEVVQSIAEVRDTGSYFQGKPSPLAERTLEDFFVQVAKLPDVLRANIYARDQKVLWSSDQTLIGKILGPNPELEEALEGKLAIESGVIGANDPKPEHLLLKSREPQFVEDYLPVRAANGGPVVGVVEVYRVPEALFEIIAQGLRLIWAIAIAGGLLLYAALYWIVRRADRLIEAQSDRLLESETLAVIGEMAGAITHGIRNPLASIRTSAELIEDDGSPAVRESARDITAEVDRLSEWVRQLLTYSKHETAQLEAVDIAEIVSATCAGFEREMHKRGIAFESAIDNRLPLVRGEPVRLAHALNSLIANALEAMPKGGRLQVFAHLTSKGRIVRVTIKDSGVGIPRDNLARVFAPFFTSKAKGLGLGLPLANRIVSRFGGVLSVVSEPDKGTEVHVDLALQEG